MSKNLSHRPVAATATPPPPGARRSPAPSPLLASPVQSGSCNESSLVSKLFELNPQGLRAARGLVALVAVLVPVVVLGAIDEQVYATSVIFAILWVGMSDPGGAFKDRVIEMSAVAGIGAVLTLWGIGIGGEAWGLVVASIFAVTAAAGLTMKFGMQRFTAAVLLNIWFVVALSLPGSYAATGVQLQAWAQTLAWLAGSALWIAVAFVAWLLRGRTLRPQPIGEFPADTSTTKLTRQAITYAVIRAVAVSAAAVITFGFEVPNADWMPIATIAAMKGSLQQTTFVAVQRATGTIIGAAVAAIVVLGVTSSFALTLVVVALAGIGAAIRYVNYTWYCAAIASLLLISMDAANPTDFSNELRRILFTLGGVAIAVVVMLAVNRFQQRSADSSTASRSSA